MKIFVEGEDYNRRAYFGWQDQDTSLIGIKMGYKNSADNLVDIALQQGEKDDIATLDTYIFPIIFLYRHAIEVSLKAIYLRCRGELLEGGHDLVNLWDNLNKEIICNLIKDKDKRNIREMLEEFNAVNDKKADVFRYLLDKNGQLYFTKSKFIDYDNLKEAMNYIYEFLDLIYCQVDDYLSA